ncbi:MAG TPA: co-chaperone GroES [Opitutales bacterium]|nr:co-chaperone GroES [Opitutales bacterium]
MATRSLSKIKITPLRDRVLVRRIDAADEIKGGIYIPETAKEKSQEAEVVALGSGKRLENGEVQAFEVKAGDRVLIAKYGGTELERDGEHYVLLSEDDILGILE